MSTERSRIESLQIERLVDDSPDTSFIGEYTDDLEPGVIVRALDEFYEKLPDDTELPERGREYRAFRPYSGGEKIGTPEYYEYGKADYARMEAMNRGEWCFIGIRAVAIIYVNGVRQKLTSAGLWGIESDCGDAYTAEAAKEQTDELREILAALGFSKAAIGKAVNAAETVDAY